MKNLDQFYTQPQLAERYIAALAERYDFSGVALVEPAAGAGAFVLPARRRGWSITAIDVEPQSAAVRPGDFLNGFAWPAAARIAVIGNPPFGFASSMAIRFFNQAAARAELIAFIVPRTFRKVSVREKLNAHFWLVHDEDVPRRAFLFAGRPHDVPCAWQVWEYRECPRPPAPAPDIRHLIEFTEPGQADFALRRVGGRAGAILPLGDGQTYSASSTYFIRAVDERAQEYLSRIDWERIRNATAGVRSVSKREIAIELARMAR